VIDNQISGQFPFCVTLRAIHWSNRPSPRIEWCNEICGRGNWTLMSMPLGDETVFGFKNKNDAIAFALRWVNIVI